LFKYYYSIDVEGCGGSLFVEDAVVIDAPLSANCKWQIKTDENHVLFSQLFVMEISNKLKNF
jgi:hypothetical protein